MEGHVLIWEVTNADTAIAGSGTVELMGLADGKKKLSAIMKTYIRATTTGATTAPPDSARPWVDQVLEAAERAEAAAERAESAGGSGGAAGGIVAETDPTVYDWAKQPQKPTYTADEVNAIGKDALPQAIEAALVQAKESGEFDGAPGLKGDPGADGGYYQPSVTDGVLSWTPSKADMPSVPASDVRGPAGQDGQPGAPGKTAYQYAQDGGYTGTEAEFAEKLAQEIPETYELPAATADGLGGVRVGSDFVMDGETLAIANGLTLFDSVEVQEGVEIKSFRWTKEAPVKEYQIFCYFPIASTAQRVSGQCGDVLWYMPQGLMTDAARYGWVKCENRTNSFPVVGYYGAKEGYSTNVPTLGNRFQPSHRTDMFIEILALIPFPVGTTVKVYVR